MAALVLIFTVSTIAGAENLNLGIGVNLIAPGPNTLTAADLMAKTSSSFVAHTVIGPDGRSRFSVYLPGMNASTPLSPYQGYIISSPRTASVSLGVAMRPSTESLGFYNATSWTLRLTDVTMQSTRRIVKFPVRYLPSNSYIESVTETALYSVRNFSCYIGGGQSLGHSLTAYAPTTEPGIIISNPDSATTSCYIMIEDASPTPQRNTGLVLFVRERYGLVPLTGRVLNETTIMQYDPATSSITSITSEYYDGNYYGSPRKHISFVYALHSSGITRGRYFTTLVRLLPNKATLASFPAGVSSYDISPDGEVIAFTAYPDSSTTAEIYTIRNDGSELKRLTTNAVDDSNPWFTVDGKTIIFTSNRTVSNGVYRMNTDGSSIRFIGAPQNGEKLNYVTHSP